MSRSRMSDASPLPRFIVVLAVAIVALAACGGSTDTSAGSPSTDPTTTGPTTPPTSPSQAPTQASWQRMAASTWRGDYQPPAQSVWDGKEMLIVVTQPNPPDCKEFVVAYDPAADSWRTLSQVPKPKGCFEGLDKVVWTGHELLLWGISNTAYDPETNTWRHLPRAPGGGGPSVVVWTGTQMIGWGGGCCDQESADGAAYTLDTNSWSKLPPSPLAGRHAAGVWTGSEMIIVGGEGGYDPSTGRITYFDDAAAYDPATRTWRKLPPMPVARGGGYSTVSYAAVWDGHEMLVVGGVTTGSTQPLARGVAYDPSTNRWRWLPPMEFARTGFVAAWASDQLVVWGGVGAGNAVPPNGERYVPATNAWSALPEAPLRARVDATAVWSGVQVLIWGGRDARSLGADRVTTLTDGAALTPGSA